jgi:hypothetical protein
MTLKSQRDWGADRGRRARSPGQANTDVVAPPCVLCRHSRRELRFRFHLSHGISVWLCPVHGSDVFVTRRSGVEFVERLAAAWAAAGVAGARRIEALRTHLVRVRAAGRPDELPGSYTWPWLRETAERRFADGEAPDHVIADLRANYRDGPAMVPSVRTMRRWFVQGRWLRAVRALTAEPSGAGRRPRPVRPADDTARRARRHLQPPPRIWNDDS